MIVGILWTLLAASLTIACVSAYFYWFAGKTAIWNMLGFYIGTGASIGFLILLILAKLVLFLT